jgi:hypothetical protein
LPSQAVPRSAAKELVLDKMPWLLLQERALKLRKWANKIRLYEPEIALLESVVRHCKAPPCRLHCTVCVGYAAGSLLLPTANADWTAGKLLLDQDVGKSLAVVKHVDVPFAISLLEYYAGWADGKIFGETVPAVAFCEAQCTA